MKEFFKNKYNIIIPGFLLLVLIIAIFLYSKEYKNNRYANINKTDVYQYYNGTKIEYTANIGRNKKNAILSFENSNSIVSLDSTPVYITSKNSTMFPKEMLIAFPIEDKQYKVNAFAEIYEQNKVSYLNTRRLNKSFEHIFYYDGNNLYYFPEEVNLIVGESKIPLSSMSYVICSYMNFVEYYDKANDKYEMIDISNEKVYVENDYMKIDIGSDRIIYKNNFSFLTKDFTSLEKINVKE